MSVKIYSTPTCSYCVKVKEFFKSNNIKFEEINVAGDSAKISELIERTGQMAVPVIEIDNDVVVGFKEDKLRELLKI